MFALDDDDGDFTAPPRGSSKLASLFGSEGGVTEQGNDSLMYVPQKQPKAAKDNPSGAKVSSDEPLKLVHAAQAHTYRYVNGRYASQGKIGCAILGNAASKDYKLLLYMSQKQPVAAAKITVNFNYLVQKSNYASFQDDMAQMWSVCFDTEGQAVEFAKQIAVAKFNSNGSNTVSLDLLQGEGQEVQKGDTVEVYYTGWLLTNHAIGKVFDSNEQGGKLFKFKVGRGKVIKGWEEGIIGLKKGGTRLLVIPPSFAYGSKGLPNRLPANASLVFVLSLKRAKFSNPECGDSSSQSSSRTESPSFPKQDDGVVSMPSETRLPSISDSPSGKWTSKGESKKTSRSESVNTDEINLDQQEKLLRSDSVEGVKARSQSINEQLCKSVEKSSGKAKLLARMSKMGHALLPPSGTGDDDVDLEDDADKTSETLTEKEDASKQHSSVSAEQQHEIKRQDVQDPQPSSSPKPHVRPKPESVHTHSGVTMPGHSYPQSPIVYPPNQQLALYQAPQPAMYGVSTVQPGSFSQVTPTVSYSSTELNLLIAESKVQHGETKLTLNRISEKIDDVNKKLDVIEITQLKNTNQSSVTGGSAEMEASVLMSNITRIVKENEKLKKDCTDKTSKIEILNEKMADLLQKNQLFLEKSNQFMEKRADSINDNTTQAMAKIIALEQENATAVAKASTAQSQVTHLQHIVESIGKEKSDLQNDINKVKSERDKFKAELALLDSSANETKDEVDQLRKVIKEGKQERKKTTLKLEQAEEELSELKLEKESLEKNLNERKKKLKGEKKKHEEEIEELKNMHEEELKALRDFYQKGGKSEESKMASLEENLRAKFEDEKQKALAEVKETWQEQLEEMNNENVVLRRRTESLSSQLSKSQGDVEEISVFKQRVEELLQEKEELKKVIAHAKEVSLEKISKLMEAVNEAEERGYTRGYQEKVKKSEVKKEEESENQPDLSEEVKKIMSGVFFKLKAKFEQEETYSGKDVIQEILQTVREVTLTFVQKQSGDKADGSESKQSEEDDDEEDKDDDDDDDDDEEEEEEEEEDDDDEEEEEDEDADEVEEDRVDGDAEDEDDGDDQEKEEEGEKEKLVEKKVVEEEVGCENNKESKGIGNKEKEEKAGQVEYIENKGDQDAQVEKRNLTTVDIECEEDKQLNDLTNGHAGEDCGVSNPESGEESSDTYNVRPPMGAPYGTSDIEENENVTMESDPLTTANDEADQPHIDTEKAEGEQQETETLPKFTEEPSSVHLYESGRSEARPNATKAFSESDEDEEDLFKDPKKQTINTVNTDSDGQANSKSLEGNYSEKLQKDKPSAFSRSPPPLFDDDDDDINWI